MIVRLGFVICFVVSWIIGTPMLAQDLERSRGTAVQLLPRSSEIPQEGLSDNASTVPPLQHRFPYPIKLKGLVAAGGSASALIEIRGTRLFLKLGERRAIGGGLTGDVLFAELDESEQLHLQFRGEATTVVFRDEYRPLGQDSE